MNTFEASLFDEFFEESEGIGVSPSGTRWHGEEFRLFPD
jgi:hypothetical protein